MKTLKAIIKPLALVLLAGVGLAGCAVVPAYGPNYGYGPEVYGPPAVVAPAISFGFHSGGRGYDDGRRGYHEGRRGYRGSRHRHR